MSGEKISNGKSSLDNINEIAWVQEKTKRDLKYLSEQVKDNSEGKRNSFYEIEADGTVSYNIGLVKQYFTEFEKRSHEEGENIYADPTCIMAVQIALESLWYDVGKIDGILWEWTKESIKQFQSDNKFNKVDGFIGPKTVKKLIECLDENEKN